VGDGGESVCTSVLEESVGLATATLVSLIAIVGAVTIPGGRVVGVAGDEMDDAYDVSAPSRSLCAFSTSPRG
jgi:hypothetical protein